MNDKDSSDLQSVKRDIIASEAARDAATAVVGALVGTAVGGIPGAMVGAAASPLLSGAIALVSEAIERKRLRAERSLQSAIQLSKVPPERAIETLRNNPQRADLLLQLINQVLEADPSLELFFSQAMSELIAADLDAEVERLIILSDAVKGLRKTHLRIISTLYGCPDGMLAADIAKVIGIPEIELRSVVRDLELRGMIKDVGHDWVKWKLRELGLALAYYLQLSPPSHEL